MKPIYWWLLGTAVILGGAAKLWIFSKLMARRQQQNLSE